MLETAPIPSVKESIIAFVLLNDLSPLSIASCALSTNFSNDWVASAPTPGIVPNNWKN